jgi:hypothetical protein
MMGAIALMIAATLAQPAADDAARVSKLDIGYQAAAGANDADAMARILDKDFVLTIGNGIIFTREQLLDSARNKLAIDEQIKEMRAGVPFERKSWFSDIYGQRSDGWRYAFGQALLPLPPEAAKW